jgi:excisionase family DNA binding protein
MKTQGDKASAAGLPKLLSAEEVSEYLGIPVTTLCRWRHLGTGPTAVRVGRHLRYEAAAVRKWLRDRAA